MMELKLSNNESGGKTQNVLKGEVRGRNGNLKTVIDSPEISRFQSDYSHILTGNQHLKDNFFRKKIFANNSPGIIIICIKYNQAGRRRGLRKASWRRQCLREVLKCGDELVRVGERRQRRAVQCGQEKPGQKQCGAADVFSLFYKMNLERPLKNDLHVTK